MARNLGHSSSMASLLRAYALPLLLFSLALFYQLVVMPRSFPPSHYDVLRIKRLSSVEDVKEAYENLASNWNSGVEVPSTTDFIKVRYAYELLSDPVWKMNYDMFGIDEQLHVIDKVGEKYAGEKFSHIELPLLQTEISGLENDAFNVIKADDFQSRLLQSTKPWIIQVYSSRSDSCAQFSDSWRRIVGLLDGLADNGMVEVGESQLAAFFAERKPTGQFFFRNGLPSIVAFPPGCTSSNCLMRFEGGLSVDAVVDWFATTVLNLPRIFYYSKESLVGRFLAKSSHKVKVILFSKTGERTTPVMRQAAKDFWNYISFAAVLWREEEFSTWWTTFGVESAPAIVFVKDPGVKPVVYHVPVNESWLLNALEENKHQELRQLRSLTSRELGCNARGYSRAGVKTMVWYCAVIAGRLSPELNKMRETIRRVQEILSESVESDAATGEQYTMAAAVALKNKRLTFAWLDGETQKDYCIFYLGMDVGYEACGPRRVPVDAPKLFIVRYERNSTNDDIKEERKPKHIWDLQKEEADPAAQLSTRYNGSAEISEIIRWVSKIIADGDSHKLPFYRAKTPDLVAEDEEPMWSKGQQRILSKSIGMKQKISSFIIKVYDHLGDPRIGPLLLLGALMAFGSVWLARSQPNHQVQSNQRNQEGDEDKSAGKKKERARTGSNKNPPPSMTDTEPLNAQKMPLSESDSE